jgi:hypothetical protein
MKKEILKEIISVANILDSSGFIREANVLDRVAKRVKVSGSFGDDGEKLTGSFFGGKIEPSKVSREDKDFATPSPSVGELKRYIVSQCKGDAYEIFLWSEGKSIVNNPPKEIRNILMGMNPKINGSNYVIDNIDAVNYFKDWIPMNTLGDEAFEYILDNNEEYLNLYKNYGRPTQRQNVQIIKKLETEGFDSDNFDALRETEDKFNI